MLSCGNETEAVEPEPEAGTSGLEEEIMFMYIEEHVVHPNDVPGLIYLARSQCE